MFGSVSFADEIRGPDGNAVNGPDLTQEAFGPLSVVSNFKILGGNFGALVAVPFANILIDSPRLDAGGASTASPCPSSTYRPPDRLALGQEMPIFAGGTDVLFAYTSTPPRPLHGRRPEQHVLGMWCNGCRSGGPASSTRKRTGMPRGRSSTT